MNDPEDPGGETKYGISKRAYPRLDIKNLTLEDASAIYKRDYWNAAGCDDLDDSLALVVFDTAVNCGVGRAKKWLAQTTDWRDYIELRKAFYKGLNKPKFLRGWLNRLAGLTQTSELLEQAAH